MRILFLILVFAAAYSFLNKPDKPLGGTNYYITNSGNDANNGLSPATAWQHISKVNAFTFSSGDSILFNRGDSFVGKLTIVNSGTAGNNIVISAYGTGVKPLITGFRTPGTFVNTIGNIWVATDSLGVLVQNTVYINGALRGMARYPNSPTTLFTTGTLTTTTIPTGLTGTPNYSGANVSILIHNWEVDRSIVSSQSGGTLNLSTPLTATTTAGTWYFLQNLPLMCDVQNEWADSSGKLYVYSTSLPLVQTSAVDTTIHVKNKSYITFDNLSISGANNVGLALDTCTNITVQNCTFKDIGANAVSGRQSTYIDFEFDSIRNCLNDGLFFGIGANGNITVNRCDFKNIGNIQGMMANNAIIGNTGTGAGVSMFFSSGRLVITGNTVDSTGYSGILFQSSNSMVKNNYVNNFCFNKDDGGGIYNAINYGGYDTIRSNIVTNGIGVGWFAACIYLDIGSINDYVDSNTCNIAKKGVLLLNQTASYHQLYDNTFISNISGAADYLAGADHVTFERNILYQTNTFNNLIFDASTPTNSLFDYNYYIYQGQTTPFNVGGVAKTFSQWKAAFPTWDIHTNTVPVSASGTFTLYINPTFSDSTISISGVKVDPKGNLYSGSVTIKPFKSILLATSTATLPIYSKEVGGFIFK